MIWKTKRSRAQPRGGSTQAVTRRPRGPERLEARRLMAADPIHIGVVYLETDYLESEQDVGSDSQGDRFILSFTGGAPATELRELRIRTDKDGDGISIGDPIYDTADGGRGKNGFHDFQLIRTHSPDARSLKATAQVDDGGQELVLRLKNFQAGDRLEFTLDVDEVLRNADNLAKFNDRLDVITSGQEFQDSILEATFQAPHYEDASVDAVFLNDYGDPSETHQLDLPPDHGDHVDSRPNRSAAAVASTGQIPKPVSIRGQVWLDNDLDQVRQTTETGLGDVELTLRQYDSARQEFVDTGYQTHTDSNGQYEFPESLGLPPGRYQVVQTQPEGLFSVAAIPGRVDGNVTGRAASKNVLTDIEIPLGGQTAADYHFAEAQTAQLSGHVYRDDNDNARRDSGEAGLGSIRVRLVPVETLASQRSLVVTTAEDGSYSFHAIAPGTYHVVELDQPAGLDDGRESPGTIDGRTVGVADGSGDQIRDITLSGNDAGIDYDFGELPLGSLAGFVYLPPAGQDCHSIDRPDQRLPLSGVEIVLQTPDGSLIEQTTTAADGSYRFDNLSRGTYRIREFTPQGLIDGGAHVGNIGGVRVGTSVSGGLLQDIVLTAGGHGVAYNFCEAAPATLSGYVYHDASHDSRKQADESGLDDVLLTLVDASGNQVASTRTDSSGYYEFTAIAPGEYSILETQPAGYLDGLDSRGIVNGDPAGKLGSDGDSVTSITLQQGEQGREFNFGERLPASLAGQVHVDLNNDGTRNSGESALAEVTIRLVDVSGKEIARTTTNPDGRYRFEKIAPGDYAVTEETPSGFFEGGARTGSAGGTTEGPNRIGQVTLRSGEVAVDYDFWEHPPASISGTVFADRNENEAVDSREPRLENVQVELYDDAQQRVATARTDARGIYRFSHLAPGSYTVREVQPPGWLHGGQTAGSHGGDATVADTVSQIPVGWGDRLTQYDFFELAPSSVSGEVFIDADGDCYRDSDESLLPGVRIDLLDDQGNRVASTTTDAEGTYRFDALAPGRYEIVEHQPSEYFQGCQKLGSGGGEILDDDRMAVTISSGVDLIDYHFPEIPAATISGYVFQDGDALELVEPPPPEELRDYRDGKRTADDRPLAGVTLELRRVDGLPASTSQALTGVYDGGSLRVTTDANGYYEFTGLRPGTYHVYQVQPEDLVDGLDTPGTTGGVAVNPADAVESSDHASLLKTLTAQAVTDPGNDAILNVTAVAGQASEDNNFSEIVVEPIAPPRKPASASRPDRVVQTPETFEPPTKVVGFGAPQDQHRAPIVAADEWAVSWHLSVINGGYPRGSIDQSFATESVSGRSISDWNEEELNRGRWVVRLNADTAATLSHSLLLGTDDAFALMGDFDGDGTDEPALFVAGQWFVDLNGNGRWDPGDLWVRLGTELDQPVVGDWDGDGKDDVGIFGRQWHRDPQRIKYDPGLPDPANQRRRHMDQVTPTAERERIDGHPRRWLRRGSDGPLRADVVDHVFKYGEQVDTPLAGDWNGDGIDQIAVFRNGKWLLDTDGDGRWTAEEDRKAEFGEPGDTPVVGDFNGDGIDEIGVVRGDTWIIDSDGDGRFTSNDVRFEMPTSSNQGQPVVGDFDGDGKDEPGSYDND